MKKDLFDRIPDSLMVPLSTGGVLSLLFAMGGISYVAHMESGEDVSRKPDLVAAMQAVSAETCAMPDEESEKTAYRKRLDEALSKARSETLDFFLKNKVTVCLDERLAQKTPRMPAVFYAQMETPVIALADQKTDPENVRARHAVYMHKFAAQFAGAALPQQDMVGYSYTRTQVCAEYCVTFQTEYAWKEADAESPVPPPPLSLALH